MCYKLAAERMTLCWSRDALAPSAIHHCEQRRSHLHHPCRSHKLPYPASSAIHGIAKGVAEFRQAGPADGPPDYDKIDKDPLNRFILSRFRTKMVAALGEDVPSQGYQAIVDLTRVLNNKYSSPQGTQEATRAILKSLFPVWLLPAFRAIFSKPMPQISCRLNAFVTALTCQWLMGKCSVTDAEDQTGKILQRQGVHIERCRYLEETQCASVCINSCKVPTQEFFARDMGLPLTMEPNYDDFSCQFSFGREPPAQAEDEAFSTPCFAICPSKRSHKRNATQCSGCTPVSSASPS